MKRKTDKQNINSSDIILMSIETIIFFSQIIVCILYYNYLGLDFLMYFGWFLLLMSFLLGWQGRAELEEKGKQGEGDKWVHTRKVVATGIYSVVRHPIYLSFALMSLTLVFLSQYWINIILGIIMLGLLYNDMRREEQDNIKKFGDKYLRYMKKVPRVNTVAGIIRLLNRNKITR